MSAYGATTPTGSQQYTGRENDGTGLYYYRARYYHPTLARFISEDPIGWAAGQTNQYARVGGNPVSKVDPKGEWAAGAIGLACLAGAALYLGEETISKCFGEFLARQKQDVDDIAAGVPGAEKEHQKNGQGMGKAAAAGAAAGEAANPPNPAKPTDAGGYINGSY